MTAPARPRFPLPETVTARQNNVRVEQETARRILARVVGMTAADAYRAVKFRPGTACAPLARVFEQGLAEARRLGISPRHLTVAAWEVGDGEVITRLRRMAHGIADWITTRTTGVAVDFKVAAPPPAADAFLSSPAGAGQARSKGNPL